MTPKNEQRAPELLAPAGRMDVFRAVLEAGADAVYIAGKQFNMRRHRKDFNFTDEDLTAATREARAAGRKLYVTVNSLVGQREIPALRDYLRRLADIGVDAVIVQDLAVVRLIHDENLCLPLHSSTMMNVSGVDTARVLKDWGFTRLVTSRDITIDTVRRIKEQAGIEVEYFLHGDLCSALSGQCLTSGIIFGKSGNRGQCMKPCRWAYDLVSESTGRTVKKGAFLLASRDMCLLQHVPELIDAGVDSLKIEGRMRPAETLAPVVRAYRVALDRAATEPLAANKLFSEAFEQQKTRTRNLTTGFAFRHPDDAFMDLSGEREPIIFSTHGRLKTVAESGSVMRRQSADLGRQAVPGREGSTSWIRQSSAAPIAVGTAESIRSLSCPLELTVVAGSVENARAAVAAGCDWLVLSWEGALNTESGWALSELDAIAEQASAQSVPVLLTTPRVLDERAARELRQVVQANQTLSGYVIASVGALEIVGNGEYRISNTEDPTSKEERERNERNAMTGPSGANGQCVSPLKSDTTVLWADTAMNVLNAESARWLWRQGVSRIMPALEASLDSIGHMTREAPECGFDLLVHGPLEGMLIEHCLIAMNTHHASKSDFCPMPCMVDHFSLVDKRGARRRIFPDRYCRNHIILEHDLAAMGYLDRLLELRPLSFRIDGRLYAEDMLSQLIHYYRAWLENPAGRQALEADFEREFPAEKRSLGAYPLGICRDDEISRIDLKRNEKNERGAK
ncbi:MAG: U32 family peptidase [Lentisphaeria bacterium]|nr:U32 family peptidase [Lentisphaeria bacterium]